MVTALYRRYRPEAFAEMIGQTQVTDPLMTALRTGRIGHAYLFSGPRGCGKTTSARILARCLNCAEGPTDAPCGTCESCVELSRDGGGSLDVVEIDAASHGGVDDARDLRERAVFAPARDRFKIFIIDEAHMVTAGGFNALLKIVEEPPPHVKFVFATTEPDKVIGTIRSRTHHYPFRLIAPATLTEYVQSLCDSEGVEAEPGVLPLVVRAGGGSVRDTLSILDQLIAGTDGGALTVERAAGLLGFTHSELLDDVVIAFGSRDAAAAFTATDRVVQTGQDPRRFVEDLLERLRDLIVVGATSVQGAMAVFRGVPEDQLQRMFEQAQTFGRAELSRVADTVSETLDKMTGATAPRLHLELMVARALVLLGDAPSAAPVASAVRAQEAVPAAPTSERTPTSAGPREQSQRENPQTQQRAAAASRGAGEESAQVPSDQSAAMNAATGARFDSSSLADSAQSVAPEVSASEAARSAREFLRNDSAGAASFGRPVTDVLGMMEKQPESSAVSAETSGQEGEAEKQSPRASLAPTESPQPAVDGTDVFGLDDLIGMWPDLLEEILESDREAWNAVRNIQPLALEGEVLTLGIASQSDLDVFKSSGADALRDAILGASGVRVAYKPKRVAVGAAPQQSTRQESGRETPAQQSGAAEATSEPEDPDPVPQSAGLDDDPVLRAAEERLAALRPRTPEPGQDDGYAEYIDPSDEDEPYAEPPTQAAEVAPVADPPAVESPQSESPKPAKKTPEFVRYGEAVVREVLSARFVEELPLPESREG
ncbi:MAG: DNA polymerase III subunit gamma and tau [Leucobacter sp.]